MTKTIIVEGIDHIGKTTWIKKCLIPSLKRMYPKYNVIYYRDLIQLNTIRQVLPNEDASFLDKKHYGILCGIINMLEAFKNEKIVFVFDRLHLSGAAYARGLRNNEEPYKFNTWFEIELKKVTEPLLVSCLLDENQIPSNDDEVVNSKQLEQINSIFAEYTLLTTLPKYTIFLKMKNGISNLTEKTEIPFVKFLK